MTTLSSVDSHTIQHLQMLRLERATVLIACSSGEIDVCSRLGDHVLHAGQWLISTGRTPMAVRCGLGARAIALSTDAPLSLRRCQAPFPAGGDDPGDLLVRLAWVASTSQPVDFADVLDPMLWPQAVALERCPGRSLERRRHLFMRLQTARRYLAGHLEHAPTLEVLASLVAVTRFHLVRVYRAAFGVTPLEDHHRMRMARAADLLARSTMPVGDVALRCGFDAGCSFARAFRQAYGATPTAWRAGAKPQLSTRVRAIGAPGVARTIGTLAVTA